MPILINVYPCFTDDFLTQGIGKPQTKKTPDTPVEVIPFEYPNALQTTYRQLKKIEKLKINDNFTISAHSLSDGIICFVVKSDLEEYPTLQEIIEDRADAEREQIETWLTTKSAKAELDKLLECETSFPEARQFKLGFAYSHSLFLPENGSRPEEFGFDTAYSASNEHISYASATSSLNIFCVNDAGFARLENYLINLTILMGVLYEIQETAVTVSRELIQTGYEKDNLANSLSLIERRVGYFHQFLAEVRLVDFLSDPFEQTLGDTTARAWDWGNLVEKTTASVNHMAVQVDKLNNEARRRSDQRLNKILFAFTFLTVMEVTSTIISLYDPENLIVPFVRILTVLSALGCAILVAKIYLLSTREK